MQILVEFAKWAEGSICDMVAHGCILSTQVVGIAGLEVHGHPQVCDREASVGYRGISKISNRGIGI